MDKALVYEDFADKVGAHFVISEEAMPAIALALVECELIKARQLPPSGRPPFSLIFAADTPQMLEQRIYRLEQEGLGAIDLFLVPVGKDSRGFLYQALFN